MCRAIGMELSSPGVLQKPSEQGSDMIIMKFRKINLAAAHVRGESEVRRAIRRLTVCVPDIDNRLY